MDYTTLLVATPTGTQAFWAWLILALILLAIEAFLGTQFLLWVAASSAIVGVVTLSGLPIGIVSQIVLFAVISFICTYFSKRFMKPPSHHSDVNDIESRHIGRDATIISGFDHQGLERQGRVDFDGVEWPAVLHMQSGDKPSPVATMGVKIIKVVDGKLHVKEA